MAKKRISSIDRKQQIAIAAATLFAKKGFNGVTTREIAKKVKINEALLFRYFPTKKALYTEIINQKIMIHPEIIDSNAARDGNDEEVFKSLARFFLKQAEEDNTFLRLLLFSALEDHKLSSLFFEERSKELLFFLNNYITKRQNSGDFKNIDPKIAIRSFVGMFFHFILAQELFRFPKFLYISKEDAIDNFVEIFLKGIKK